MAGRAKSRAPDRGSPSSGVAVDIRIIRTTGDRSTSAPIARDRRHRRLHTRDRRRTAAPARSTSRCTA
ncbi:MAG: hypothetical protein MZU95_14575 [Desulfomicrobium escambiense]|nr:hypothetical protein [Desulfomicrobium escambiense]